QPDDGVAGGQEAFAEVGADEAGGAGDEAFHGNLPWPRGPARGVRGPGRGNVAGGRAPDNAGTSALDGEGCGVYGEGEGRLAQLARAPARHAGGHWFKSSSAHS